MEKIIEKIRNNKFLYFIAQFLNNTISAIIIFPLVDMFFCNIIHKKEFIYSLQEHIIEPIMFGFFSACIAVGSKKIVHKKLNLQKNK